MSYGRRRPPDIEGMVSLKVDNLTYRTTPESLKRMFERYGDVGDVYIPRDRFTQESRGFAFVRFYDERDADDAIKALDGSTMDGRELRVQLAKHARPAQSSGRRGGAPQRSRGRRRSDSRSRSRSRSHRRRRSSRSRSRSQSNHSRHNRSRSRSRDRNNKGDHSGQDRDESRGRSKSAQHKYDDDDRHLNKDRGSPAQRSPSRGHSRSPAD